MINETVQIIRANTDIITSISGIILGLGTIGIALWIAYFSPQALQARIERKKYLYEKRQEHYSRLNHEIFDPLAKNIFLVRSSPQNELDSYKIGFTQVNQNFLKKGMNHLENDFPEFSKEFHEIKQRVKEYNETLLKFSSILESKIRYEFNGTLELNENYSFDQDFYIISLKPMKEVILVLLSRLIKDVSDYNQNYIHRLCNTAINTHLDGLADVIFEKKIPFQIFGYCVTNFPTTISEPEKELDEELGMKIFETIRMNELTKNQIINHICAISSDENVFSLFRNIVETHNQLLIIGNEISEKIKIVSDAIKNLDYETIAQCCTDKKLLK